MHVRSLASLFVLATLSLVPAAARTSGNKAALESALSTVKADEIQTDLYFIASDDLKGRDTPSEGLNVAASYLRARLKRLGWQPGAKDGYDYVWQVEKKGLEPANCHVEFAGHTLTLGKDYFLSGFGIASARETSGKAIWGGDGDKDALGKLELDGKWLVLSDHGRDLGALRRELLRKGLAGIVCVPAADYADKPYTERFSADLERQIEGSVAQVREASPATEEDSDRSRRPRGAPTVFVLPEAKAALFGALGVQEGQTPVGKELAVELKESRALAGNGGLVDVQNVCGFWPGSDPVLKNEVLIVSAHYDHVGVMRGQIYNGADDNGSGTCCLLSLAEALKQYGPLRRSVMLMWVCGEEKGLWGSEAWNKHPYLPEGCKAVADINIDMVGRNAPDKLLITPTHEHKSYSFLTKVAETYAPLEGFPKLGSADEYWHRSDHYNFVQAGIPACFLFSDVHEDYHKPTDDPDKIDYDKIHRVARLVLRMLDGLQDDKIDG
ncbi:MAG: M28 family peptidase [Planctomycetes bacterium]|nr:M28 family peptidase [Planctomycetota bacterium]